MAAGNGSDGTAGSDEIFTRVLDQEILDRMIALAEGILAYRRHPYHRDLVDPGAVWRAGTTCLRDYGKLASGERRRPDAIPILVIPSLVNRAYVMDLKADTSFLRWLVERGFHPFLVDWDAPGEEERDFDLTDYIVRRLEPALDQVKERCGRAPFAMGYCMGGVLALALAQRRASDLAGVVLLATPWDFHSEADYRARLATSAAKQLEPVMASLKVLPVDAIQSLLSSLDPLLVVRKFLSFGKLDQSSRKVEAFVALEDWLNDGIPLAAKVARECLSGWYGQNSLAKGKCKIAGRPLLPGEINQRCLSVIPAGDRIVPPSSARALADALPRGEVATPHAGHIGMMVSGSAHSRVWEPLEAWLRS